MVHLKFRAKVEDLQMCSSLGDQHSRDSYSATTCFQHVLLRHPGRLRSIVVLVLPEGICRAGQE